ncbi:MAG: endonuclease/exonuclease/phosphatase family protein [Bacteroidetes bacterium]|nr:endonuclease/exonuclease/phosphatase family protein [Bacteroidota bacterium]
MKKLFPFLFLALIILSACNVKKSDKPEMAQIAFYNVENLFDTVDDPNVNDEEFTPEGRQNWNSEKYATKLDHISQVFLSMDSTQATALIGMAEVENRQVLTDLIRKSHLNDFKYEIIHQESPDFRGIDVALIYKPDIYSPIINQWYAIHFPFDSAYTTRDILYSKGNIFGDKVLHIFVNHWTSRSGGQEITDAKRIFIASFLKTKTDSILSVEPDANIIIMGDLNDNPTDVSITESLNALPVSEQVSKNNLYNLSLNKFQNGEGTLYYNSWDLFDQIIVSGSLLIGNSSIITDPSSFEIYKPDWIVFEDNKGIKRPNRTASGNRYYGGYSDHLPVYITIKKN